MWPFGGTVRVRQERMRGSTEESCHAGRNSSSRTRWKIRPTDRRVYARSALRLLVAFGLMSAALFEIGDKGPSRPTHHSGYGHVPAVRRIDVAVPGCESTGYRRTVRTWALRNHAVSPRKRRRTAHVVVSPGSELARQWNRADGLFRRCVATRPC